MARTVLVPFDRFAGWVERFDAAHPGMQWTVAPELVQASSPDGTSIEAAVPIRRTESDAPTLDELRAHLLRPWQLGIVLVRRGGFAVAHVRGSQVVDSKVGQRHVQGRTKAGGWSQQRFARRRDNQARAAFDAAAEHVVRLLAPEVRRLDALALGGDRKAIDTVLAEVGDLARLPQIWLGGVADPKRDVLNAAIGQARSVVVRISDPDGAGH